MTDAVVHVNPGPFAGAPEGLLERAVRLTLARAGSSKPAGPEADASKAAAGRGEISLTLLSDAEISDLNARYLGRSGPTDVLAFSLGAPDAPLGDVYVGYEQAARQAREHGVPVDQELARLAIHGTLHVLGYDHPEGPERTGSPMFTLQERLLDELQGRIG